MANVNVKTATPLTSATVAADDRIVLGDVSADAFGCVEASALLQALASVAADDPVVLKAGTALTVRDTLTVRQSGGVAGTDEVQVYHDGSNGFCIAKDGTLYSVYVDSSLNVGTTQLATTTWRTNNFDSAAVSPASGANTATFRVANDRQFGWGSANTLSSGTIDTGLKRAAAAVVATTDGSTGTGWLQNSAGSKRVANDVTNATTTMANVTDATFTTIAGRKYSGKIGLFVSNTTAANGIKFDFDGGTGTWTSFRAAICSNVQGATLGATTISSAIATDLLVSSMNGTGDHYIELVISGVANAAGTCILRFAEDSTGGGLASVLVNSFELISDVP